MNVDNSEQTTRKYIFFRTKKTWNDALKHCQEFTNTDYSKGSLAIIKNKADLQSISEVVPNNHKPWIGLKGSLNDGYKYPDNFYSVRNYWANSTNLSNKTICAVYQQSSNSFAEKSCDLSEYFVCSFGK